jgi:excinuclease ABC subunit C
LKRQRQTSSVLEDIPGIGPVTRRKLLKTFGSLRGVGEAPEDELAAIIGDSKAKLVKQLLRK